MAAHIVPNWKPAFLDALRVWPVVQQACTAANVCRSTAYRARMTDPTFAQEWDEAMEDGIDLAEAEAYRRAVRGFDEPVIHHGQLAVDADGKPLTVKRYSDRLLELILRGRRKDVYSQRIEQTGANGAPLIPTDETQRAMRIEALLTIAQRRKDAEGLA
jgi:hypothetical protein